MGLRAAGATLQPSPARTHESLRTPVFKTGALPPLLFRVRSPCRRSHSRRIVHHLIHAWALPPAPSCSCPGWKKLRRVYRT